MKTTKRILVLLCLMVVTMGAWADPTMTLTIKQGDSRIPGMEYNYVMEKVEGEDNLWKKTLTIPATPLANNYNFVVNNKDGNTTVNASAGKGYFRLATESEVTFYALIKDDKVRSSCDGMNIHIGNTNWFVYGIIPSAIGQETSTAYLNITATNFEFFPLADIAASTMGNQDELRLNYGTGNSTPFYIVTLANGAKSAEFNGKKNPGTLNTGIYKATVKYKECIVEIEQANTYPVKISSAGATTLVLPMETTIPSIPSGLKAYTLKYDGGDKLKGTEVKGTIPANTPVLLNGTPNETYYFDVTASASYTSGTHPSGGSYLKDVPAEPQDGDIFYGVMEPHLMIEGSYVLQDGKYGIGFYQVPADVRRPIHPFRAYVKLPDAEARSLSIVFDDGETTGITDVKGKKEDVRSDIFNLSGQRVGKNYKGVVIKNGRKMIQK